MCNEPMRLIEHERSHTIPGTRQVVKEVVREWVCPECDYFEEPE
jgi:hypothetical protein